MAVFNEDTRVKIPATIQFLRLDYNYQSLNYNINYELESMAKTIYDYWFLQFEFPNVIVK